MQEKTAGVPDSARVGSSSVLVQATATLLGPFSTYRAFGASTTPSDMTSHEAIPGLTTRTETRLISQPTSSTGTEIVTVCAAGRGP